MLSFVLSDARELAALWDGVLGQLEVEVTGTTFATYLAGTKLAAFEEGCLIVESPKPFAVDTLNFTLRATVERVVAKIAGEELVVRFAARRAAPVESPLLRPPSEEPGCASLLGKLNPGFTFERYVVTDANRTAHGCCAEATVPGLRHPNTIVLYGGPGMGKSHLLHALGQRALAAGWSVACISAEQFTNDYLASIRGQTARDFQARIRNVRLLMVDDLQDFHGKSGTQKEFVWTVDSVANGGGMVAVASERDPDSLDLPPNLKSRLRGGNRFELAPLAAPERACFVELLLGEYGCPVPAGVVQRIASFEAASVRDLQGLVGDVAMALRHHGADLGRIDAAILRAAASRLAPQGRSDDEVVSAVARHFALSFEEVLTSRRTTPTDARAVAVALLQERGRSLSQISSLIPRDTASLKGAGERGRRRLAADPGLKALAG
jgi:chromosomal replication initiator protein